MAKTILKIFYIALGLVLAVLFGVLNYNTSADEAYIDILNTAANSEDAKDLVHVFSSFSLPYDKNPMAEAQSADGKNKLTMFGSINQLNISYIVTENGEEVTKTDSKIEFIYYVFIKDVNYASGNKLEDNKLINKSGIRFYNEDGKAYDYHFVVSDSVNSEEYKAKPTNSTEGLINSKRDFNNAYNKKGNGYNFNFVLMPISESLVNYAKTQLDNKDIVKFNILDNAGNALYNDISLDINYTQAFFNDLSEFRDSFRTYYDESKKDTEEYKKATEYLNSFNIANLKNDNYQEGLKKDDVYTAKLVWRSIGIGALFVLSFTIIYFVLFHFGLIKRLVFRQKKSNTRYVPNKPRGGNPYQAKNKNNVIDVKPEEVKADKEKEEK